jgi:transposase
MYQFIISFDISKLTLDSAIISNGELANAKHQPLENKPEAISKLFKTYSKQPGFTIENCLICIEAIGVYSYPLLSFVANNNMKIWIESGTQIKKSAGIQRGKSDKIDAIRIAEYAFKNQEKARIWVPSSPIITEIKHLTSLRDRLVKSRHNLVIPVKEFEQIGDLKMAKTLNKAMKSTVDAIEADINKIEKQIIELLNGDTSLKELFSLVTTVVGIGTQTALGLIIYTDAFKLFDDARKLACYAGVAPFEYSSGTSIRGKTRVSKMANKTLKTLLHMAALTAVKVDLQLKLYYERKVGEGKAKMSVLNAVKAKLLYRVMSVVQRKQKYENSANFSLVLS